MTDLDRVDRPTVSLIRLAALMAIGDPDRLARAARAAVDDEVPTLWGDELVLQTVLMAGYPRALGGAVAWRAATGRPAEWLEDGRDSRLLPLWQQRGEASCRAIYGANYQRLRDNVAHLHPALDAWMVLEGYGKTLSRPGLDTVRRELCVVAQCLVLEAEVQLHSHLRGALNLGASVAEIERAIDIAGKESTADAVVRARRLWENIQASKAR